MAEKKCTLTAWKRIYERLAKAESIRRKLVVLSEVAREGHFENELEKWTKEVECLKSELALAESKLLEAQRALGVNNKEKLTYWIKEFVKAKTVKRAASTMRGYGTVSKLVEEYNPVLLIKQVDKHPWAAVRPQPAAQPAQAYLG